MNNWIVSDRTPILPLTARTYKYNVDIIWNDTEYHLYTLSSLKSPEEISTVFANSSDLLVKDTTIFSFNGTFVSQSVPFYPATHSIIQADRFTSWNLYCVFKFVDCENVFRNIHFDVNKDGHTIVPEETWVRVISSEME